MKTENVIIETVYRLRYRGNATERETTMHLKSNADITKFLLTVKHCQSDVFYESDEGDVLNLASTLEPVCLLFYRQSTRSLAPRYHPL